MSFILLTKKQQPSSWYLSHKWHRLFDYLDMQLAITCPKPKHRQQTFFWGQAQFSWLPEKQYRHTLTSGHTALQCPALLHLKQRILSLQYLKLSSLFAAVSASSTELSGLSSAYRASSLGLSLSFWASTPFSMSSSLPTRLDSFDLCLNLLPGMLYSNCASMWLGLASFLSESKHTPISSGKLRLIREFSS